MSHSMLPTMSRRQFLQITAAAGLTLGVGYLSRTLRAQLTTIQETRVLMGTVVNLALVTEDKQEGERVVAAAFAEMERLIALFDHRQPDTPLARLNQTGQLTQAPPELIALIAQAIEYGRLTAGAFDISIKPLLDARKAGATDWEEARQWVDYRQIKIAGSEIHFEVPGMGLTLDGIAKGRVVDGATALLRTNGFDNILVEAGGDLMGYGFNADDQPWQVGITHPRQSNILSVLPVQAQAVATSGDYMNSFSHDFSLHHILDPRTGHSPTQIASATAIAPTATDADALSTALMVLGVEAGLALANGLPNVEALLIDKEMGLHRTSGFPL